VWRLEYRRLSRWDFVYSVDLAIACLVTYGIMVFLIPRITGRPGTSVGILWAVISVAFVYKDSRNQTVAAAISRLLATLVSFALCLAYLCLFPATALGLAGLIVAGTLIVRLLGRPDEISLAAISTAIVMIVAANDPQKALLQPWLRLLDTVVGVTVGIACKWIASLTFYRIIGEEVR
jgi:uncharacterized membrane protein YccC